MYYPIQIPYILDKTFIQYIQYTEEILPEISDFVICYWQMIPIKKDAILLENIIILDGGIDLIVDFNKRLIGFSGMSTSNYHIPIQTPANFMGFRLMPAAFHQLTGRVAQDAMDVFLPILNVYPSFDLDSFFTLSFDEAKKFLINFIITKCIGLQPNQYVKLFNELILTPPSTVKELCVYLHLSPSQCQRNFIKHYGLSPKVILSVLRFQKSLSILLSSNTEPKKLLDTVDYYDQSHFINDFKRNIGITPLQLLNRYNGND